MPYYCFTTKDGETVERNFPMGAVPPSIKLSAKAGAATCRRQAYRIAYRDYAAENVKGTIREATATKRSGGWPIECYASGVHASQAQELRDYLKGHGVPTEVTERGDPVYTSQRHQEKALKVRGMHNKSSFN